MNLPNKLTMLRILLVPVFVAFASIQKWSYQIVATAIFIVASFTDMLDGRIARSQHLVTDFGKFMDPIADKMLVMSALVMLVEHNRMPGWVCMLMLAREFAVSGFRLVAAGKGKVIAAGIWGKLKTISQMIYIPMALMLVPMARHGEDIHDAWDVLTTIMMYISLALAVWSGFDYIWKNRSYIKDM